VTDEGDCERRADLGAVDYAEFLAKVALAIAWLPAGERPNRGRLPGCALRDICRVRNFDGGNENAKALNPVHEGFSP